MEKKRLLGEGERVNFLSGRTPNSIVNAAAKHFGLKIYGILANFS
jgi:hypothetical protein